MGCADRDNSRRSSGSIVHAAANAQWVWFGVVSDNDWWSDDVDGTGLRRVPCALGRAGWVVVGGACVFRERNATATTTSMSGSDRVADEFGC